ncbi:MAG TPA: hypothetical protein VK834_10265 [Bradyrhizobium sp.]|nr:hypothetical protein [Bradyrhizobium sp.]
MHNFKANSRTKTFAICHAMLAVLAIRLIRSASFREKLRQLIVKMRKEKAPVYGRFCVSRNGRVRGKF